MVHVKLQNTNAQKRCLKTSLKVKVYLAEQITEYKVYWCLIKKLTQKSGFDNRVSVI